MREAWRGRVVYALVMILMKFLRSITMFGNGLRPAAVAGLVAFVLALPAGAAEFTLWDIHGDSHKLSDYRGKWVVVNYWATWCPPCLDEIPELVDFHDRHKDKDAVVLGVNLEDIGARRLQEFSESFLISYPVLMGSPDPRSTLGPIPGLPTTYVVSPDGEVVARNVGPLTSKSLEDFIQRMARTARVSAAERESFED